MTLPSVAVSRRRYRERVAHDSVPSDTDPAVYALLTERWRSMELAERVELMEQLCFDVERIARADIATRHPTFTETEVCHELARRRYGVELADAAFVRALATQ